MSTVQYSLHPAPRLRLIMNSVHMFNMCDNLFSEGQHCPNIYTLRNRSLLNHDIPRLGEYFNYSIRDSIRFLVLICLEIRCNYFFSFAVSMANSSLVLSLIILLDHVLFFCLIILQRILDIISCTNNKCHGLTFSVVCYVLHIPYE